MAAEFLNYLWAQPAIQQARNLAKNLNAGEMRTPFKYNDKGTMATIGRNKAIAQVGKMTFVGRFAWWLWMLIHLISILGVRTKVTVLLNWIWNYCTYSTSLRLLMRPTKYPLRRHWGIREFSSLSSLSSFSSYWDRNLMI